METDLKHGVTAHSRLSHEVGHRVHAPSTLGHCDAMGVHLRRSRKAHLVAVVDPANHGFQKGNSMLWLNKWRQSVQELYEIVTVI